jgi:isochorismate hydrolase
MQIHEITEGLLSNISRGFVQGVSGADLPRAQPTADVSALKTAAAAQMPTTERIVVTVTQPGQSVPAQYYKVKDAWTNELGNAIADPRQTAYLDKLIPTHGKKETITPAPVARKISRRRIAQ